jgi:hypothetical protein
MQSLAFAWICQREQRLLHEPALPWRSVRHLDPNDPLRAQTAELMNLHMTEPPTSQRPHTRVFATLPPPPPPDDDARPMRPWHAQGPSDGSAGIAWRPRAWVDAEAVLPAAPPGKVFEYECSGTDAKKKKYRAYDDAQQRVLWQAYQNGEDDVSLTVGGEYEYTVFLDPKWVQRSHATGYERLVRLRDW